MSSLIIRLKKRGKRNQKINDIVVSYSLNSVFSAPIAKIGYFDKNINIFNIYNINYKLLNYWIAKGAIIHKNVLKILKTHL